MYGRGEARQRLRGRGGVAMDERHIHERGENLELEKYQNAEISY